jgi:acetylserotonin N-methyltransferase
MSPQPDASNILELIGAFRRSKALFTAVRFGIFDRLESTPQSAAQLAAALDLNAGALSRLLDGCVGLALLEREGAHYRNTTAASRYLVSTSPDTLAGYIVYSDQSLYPLWGHLGDAIREGSHRWVQVFGSRESLFEHYFRDEVSKRSFLGGMHGLGQLTSAAIVSAFDLSGYTHMADLGGATGHLVIAACRCYPSLRATVLDLPGVAAVASEYIAASGCGDRIQFLAADFFKDPLPPADLYSVGRILHDWGDERIKILLPKIAAQLPSGGALLIAETLMNEDRSGPVYTLMQDLNMLVCTDGKERTASEYLNLLTAAGFSSVDFRRTDWLVDAILARKG